MREFLSPIEDIIDDARNGRLFILVDDEDRENEGDLVIPAQMATPDAINFMARFGRGLICLPLSEDRVDALDLPLMSPNNQSRHRTAFTVSIEARNGITTGISAADRAHTVAVAIDHRMSKYDIVSPGHIFPLVARDGGVLVRAGHTEASVDISRLAGLNPSAVICEIMKDDGTMARLPDLIDFSREHGLKVATIRDLIAYRLKNEVLVRRLSETEFTRFNGHTWSMVAYAAMGSESEVVALQYGDFGENDPVMVRMHSLNPLEDLLDMDHPRSGQLSRAMEMIEAEGRGVMVIFPGLFAMRPSQVINEGPPQKRDSALRDYGVGAQILRDLGVSKMILLSNTAQNIVGLEGYGLEKVDQRPIPERSTDQKKET